MKRLSAFICALVLICVNTSVVFAAEYDVEAVIVDTANTLKESIPYPQYGSVGGEWLVFGLARSGIVNDSEYFNTYYKNISEYVSETKGILHERKYSEYSRVVIALSALGKNPADVSGYNLLSPLADFNSVIYQGINGPVFALLALDSAGYEIPQIEDSNKIQATRQMYVDYILSRQSDDGGFSVSSDGRSEIDATAMALQALNNYSDDLKVKDAMDRAFSYLSEKQCQSGGFSDYERENCESASQVLTALAVCGIDVNDERFVKNGNTLLDAVMNYYRKGEGFLHFTDDTKTDAMSGEQALYALVAYSRMKNGRPGIFDMSDVLKDDDESITPNDDENTEKFSDISQSRYREEIERLASKNILSGKTKDMFYPYAEMSRAEFATAAVRAFGLSPVFEDVFLDVNKDDWFYGYIAAAYKNNIVSGISQTEFDPYGFISLEQAAVLIKKCAEVCGIDTALGSINNLSLYDDRSDVAQWAKESVEFCLNNYVIIEDGMNLSPKRRVMRDEMAHMIYRVLEMSNRL